MNEIMSFASKGSAWSIFVVIIVVIWGAPAIFSREGAQKLWLIGRFVQWVNTRQERSIERERRIGKTTVEALRADMSAMRDEMQAERERSSASERRLQRQIDTQMSYIEWSTGWARDVIIMAAQHGWQPPVPPWTSFHEWRERHIGPQRHGAGNPTDDVT